MKQHLQQPLWGKVTQFWNRHANDMDFLCATTIIYVLAIIFVANMNDPFPQDKQNTVFLLQ